MRRLLLVVTCVALSLSACQQGGTPSALPKAELDWCRAHGWTLLNDNEMSASLLATRGPGDLDWAPDGSGGKYNAVCDRVYNENH